MHHVKTPRGRPSSHQLPSFKMSFRDKHRIKTKDRALGKQRKRKLYPEKLFQTVVHLVGGSNQEGYQHALVKSFGSDTSFRDMPAKSALAQARQKISYQFFEEELDKLIHRFEPQRQTFRGLRIYAIDGQQLILPRTPDIVEAGYTGRAIGKYRETYMPRGYITHAYDVLSGVTKDLCFGPSLNEVRDAKRMIKGFEQNSLTLYDRLYFHPGLALAHEELGHCYLARCRSNASKEIKQFHTETWRKKKTVIIDGVTVHLFKFWNSKEGEWDIFATNLPACWHKPKLIRKLYRLRWEVETSFLELTAITKIEQWHSKSINGILQELFALFWLINYTKIQIFFRTKRARNPLLDGYKKPNFKLIFNYLLLTLSRLFKKIRGVLDDLSILIKRSTERRHHNARTYPRHIRSPASPYPYYNTFWYWDLK